MLVLSKEKVPGRSASPSSWSAHSFGSKQQKRPRRSPRATTASLDPLKTNPMEMKINFQRRKKKKGGKEMKTIMPELQFCVSIIICHLILGTLLSLVILNILKL